MVYSQDVGLLRNFGRDIASISKQESLRQKRTIGRVTVQKESQPEQMFYYDGFNDEGDKIMNYLDSQKIDNRMFQHWSQNNLMIWIAFELIPEILHDNLKNLNNINKILERFSLSLMEYQYIIKGNKPMANQFGLILNPQESESQKFETISLSNLEKQSIDDLRFRYVNWNAQKFSSAEQVKESLDELRMLLIQRRKIDEYFITPSIQLVNSRILITSILQRVQKENFIKESQILLSQKNQQIQFQDIILRIVTTCFSQGDKFYQQQGKNILIQQSYQMFEPNKQDLFIEKKSKDQLTIHLGKDQMKMRFSLQETLVALTLSIFHILKNHQNYLQNIKDSSALGKLIERIKD